MTPPEVMVIGLDGAPPDLIFGEWAYRLPTLSALARRGAWGHMESITPPITVPAWACMMTSRDPGTLGIYGFRNRHPERYELRQANSADVRVPTVWDRASKAGKDCIVIGVPPSYPVKPLNGILVSCFLAPGPQADFTYPSSLKEELAASCPPYVLDVPDFRSGDTGRIMQNVYQMTDSRFAAADYLLSTKPCDLFIMVEIGTDRMNHALWSYADSNHPRHVRGSALRGALLDYYVAVDGHIGRLLDRHAGERTSILVVSDHGAMPREGNVCLNDWLRAEGHLALREKPRNIVRLAPDLVDWAQTTAWGDGGYYGRLFLNVAGRDPAGVVDRAHSDALLNHIAAGIREIAGPDGEPLANEALRPAELYRVVNGFPPDLMATFGDLRWRSSGSCGHASIHAYGNDTGLDEANHARHGICVVTSPVVEQGRRDGLRLYDVAPTILDLLHLDADAGAFGRSLM